MKEKTTTVKDPRTHVTAHAFTVADELLDHDLAKPWQRAAALLLDVVVVFALAKTQGIVFSILLGCAAFWLIVRGARTWPRRLGRGALAVPIAVAIFLGSWALIAEDDAYPPSTDQWRGFGEAMGSDDPKIREAARLGLEESFEKDLENLPIGDVSGLSSSSRGFEIIDAARLAELDRAAAATAADTLEAFVAALRAGDVEALENMRQDAAQWLVGEQMSRLERERRQLLRDYAEVTGENQVLREQVENPSLTYLARALAGDLGLTIGWTGLYFTLVPALWGGRTLGKALLRIRIVRLDLSRLGPWASFERFAAYSAGLATGLLGFLQIFWDPNRQGVQDKIVGTVVIREVDRW